MLKFRPFLSEDDGAGSGASASNATVEASTNNEVETDTGESNTEVETEVHGEVAEPQQEQPKQSKEVDSAFAKMRREKEEAERKARELETKATAADKWVEENFGQSHDLHTWDDYQNALRQQQQQQIEESLKEQGLSLKQIKDILKQDPEYQEMMRQNKEYQESLKKQQQYQHVKSQFEELASEYPEFKSMDDLNKIPEESWDKIVERMNRGYSLLDAYEVVNKQEIKKKAAEAAKQQTLNNINGKAHIKENGGNSNVESVTIPDETLKLYKKLNPGKSYDEYLAHYKKSLGGN